MKKGTRVDVNNVITEDWQSNHWVKNAYLIDVLNKNGNKVYHIGSDDKTESSHMGIIKCTGLLSSTSFNIKQNLKK